MNLDEQPTTVMSWWDHVARDDAERWLAEPDLKDVRSSYWTERVAWRTRQRRLERRLVMSTLVLLTLAVLLSLLPDAFWIAFVAIVGSVSSYLTLVFWERVTFHQLNRRHGRR